MFAIFSAAGTTQGKSVLHVTDNETINLTKNRKGSD